MGWGARYLQKWAEATDSGNKSARVEGHPPILATLPSLEKLLQYPSEKDKETSRKVESDRMKAECEVVRSPGAPRQEKQGGPREPVSLSQHSPDPPKAKHSTLLMMYIDYLIFDPNKSLSTLYTSICIPDYPPCVWTCPLLLFLPPLK